MYIVLRAPSQIKLSGTTVTCLGELGTDSPQVKCEYSATTGEIKITDLVTA